MKPVRHDAYHRAKARSVARGERKGGPYGWAIKRGVGKSMNGIRPPRRNRYSEGEDEE